MVYDVDLVESINFDHNQLSIRTVGNNSLYPSLNLSFRWQKIRFFKYDILTQTINFIWYITFKWHTIHIIWIIAFDAVSIATLFPLYRNYSLFVIYRRRLEISFQFKSLWIVFVNLLLNWDIQIIMKINELQLLLRKTYFI